MVNGEGRDFNQGESMTKKNRNVTKVSHESLFSFIETDDYSTLRFINAK